MSNLLLALAFMVGAVLFFASIIWMLRPRRTWRGTRDIAQLAARPLATAVHGHGPVTLAAGGFTLGSDGSLSSGSGGTGTETHVPPRARSGDDYTPVDSSGHGGGDGGGGDGGGGDGGGH
jgi:hypothetical protein